jgi:hypothetical protein
LSGRITSIGLISDTHELLRSEAVEALRDSDLPSTAIVEAGPVIIYVLHNIDDLDLDPAAAGFQIVSAAIPISRVARYSLAFSISIPGAPARDVFDCP